MMTIVLVSFAVMLIIGTPIAFVLGLAGLIALLTTSGRSFLFLVPQQIFSGMDSYVLMAIPFYCLAGELMNALGISERIIKLANALVGHFKGGLGHVNCLESAMFAGISGSAAADVAGMGTILIPAMTDSGYSKPYATAITAATSVVGPTIPPSIPMVVFGSAVGVSVAGLFASGILPGLLMTALMMVVNHMISARRGYQAYAGNFSWTRLKEAVREGILALVMPVIIIGGILGGIFTPTEAAAVAVGYALLVGGLAFKTLNPKVLWDVLKRTVYTTGVSLLLVSMGGVLSWVLAAEQIPAALASFLMGISTSRSLFMVYSCIFLLIVGCFMDLTAAIIILAPILTPVAVRLGVNPLHFGAVMVIALNIGLITPPVGGVLFVACAVGRESIENVMREIWPFVLCLIAALAVVAFSENFVLVVPRLLGLAG
ncbi:MAG TPA: C4-dicarboxylate ABC transporter permease [Firmicutes bacterium]|nr:C4-dicarboxylate ABC transporter permease [Bacillota bacterium]